MQNKNIISWSSLIVLAVLFLALIMLNNVLFRGVRLDLTENNLYTLSDGTREILSAVEEPIHLRLFFSEETSRGFPLFRAYYQRVREMLQEFEQRSDGKVQVSFIDPKPFSEEEDQAAVYGIQAAPVGNAGDSFYFGLAGTNAVDSLEVVPFFDPRRERFLEYELAKLVYALDHPELPRLGIISSLRINGGFNPQTQRPEQPYTVYDQLQQFYEVVDIETTATELPEDLDALMIIHPKTLPSSLLYAIDQFALNGGSLMIFVDPFAQNDSAQPNLPGVPPQGGGSSDLPKLFEAWGLKYRNNFFAGDLRYALEVNSPSGPVRHAGILGLNQEAMSKDDVITATLSTINISTAGFFEAAEESTLTLEPLLTTSENSQPISSLLLKNTPDVTELLQNFESTGEVYNLAVRLNGTVSTAFPDGAPGGGVGEHLSEGQLNAIVVGDTEMLSDPFWVQRQSFFGQSLATPFASNGDFVLNMADNLVGDANLISVRPRDVSTRPFTLVQELRLEAEKQYRNTELQLEQELRETEAKLTEMQRGRSGEGDLTVLSDEQQQELQRFLDRKLEIRKELRQVRRNLDRDIENLGVWLKAINILLVPILVAVAAVFYFLRRRRRQQQAGAAS